MWCWELSCKNRKVRVALVLWMRSREGFELKLLHLTTNGWKATQLSVSRWFAAAGVSPVVVRDVQQLLACSLIAKMLLSFWAHTSPPHSLLFSPLAERHYCVLYRKTEVIEQHCCCSNPITVTTQAQVGWCFILDFDVSDKLSIIFHLTSLCRLFLTASKYCFRQYMNRKGGFNRPLDFMPWFALWCDRASLWTLVMSSQLIGFTYKLHKRLFRHNMSHQEFDGQRTLLLVFWGQHVRGRWKGVRTSLTLCCGKRPREIRLSRWNIIKNVTTNRVTIIQACCFYTCSHKSKWDVHCVVPTLPPMSLGFTSCSSASTGSVSLVCHFRCRSQRNRSMFRSLFIMDCNCALVRRAKCRVNATPWRCDSLGKMQLSDETNMQLVQCWWWLLLQEG